MPEWEGERYHRIQSEYQFRYGTALLEKLNERFPLAGRAVADLGCGEGSLTARIAALAGNGGSVVGVDPDGSMLARARETQREISFFQCDALGWLAQSGETYDVLFSNAMLHWLKTYPMLADYFRLSRRRLRKGGVGACRFSLKDNAEEAKEFLQGRLRLYLQDNALCLSRCEFTFEDCARLIAEEFPFLEREEFYFQPFSDTPALNFEWLVNAQPIAGYFPAGEWKPFVAWLYEEWRREPVEVLAHQCAFLYS